MVSEPQAHANPTSSMASSTSSGFSSSSSSSSSTTTTITAPFIPNFTQFISLKLDSSNYLMWQSQVLPVLRSNDLLGIVDETEPSPPRFLTNEQGESIVNPEYTLWNKKDQLILSWINATLSEAVLATVYGLNTSRQVWSAWQAALLPNPVPGFPISKDNYRI
jgi:hypothetical protein